MKGYESVRHALNSRNLRFRGNDGKCGIVSTSATSYPSATNRGSGQRIKKNLDESKSAESSPSAVSHGSQRRLSSYGFVFKRMKLCLVAASPGS